MYFDTHAHYDFHQFKSDRTELLERILPESGIELITNVGASMEGSRRSVELAERYDYVYATVGVHPSEADDIDIAQLERLAAHRKCVAIGEIGLDYHYDNAPSKEVQLATLKAQMQLARKLGKRVVFHDRDAHEDSMSVVREFPDVTGVFHCFSGSREMAMQLVRLGWYISFTGVVTYRNAQKFPEIVAALPIERIMIETDSPYLTPEPNRGKRNDSSNLRYTCDAIARFRDRSHEEIAAKTLENGKRFFGID